MRKSILFLICFAALSTRAQEVFKDNFDERGIKDWTVIDANNDGATWRSWNRTAVNQIAQYDYSMQNAADDYLVSQAITVEPGVYTLSFDYYTSTYVEDMDVFYGTEPTVGALSNLIVDLSNIKTNKQYVNSSTTFSIDKAQTIYLAFHAKSKAGMDYLAFDEVTLTKTGSLTIGTNLYGSVIYAEGIDYSGVGLYQFNVDDFGVESAQQFSHGIQINNGAAYRDGKYYMGYFLQGSGAHFDVWDVASGTREKALTPGQDCSLLSTTMALDPVTNVIYGEFYDELGEQTFWGTLDTETMTVTHLAEMNRGLLFIAANRYGQFYAVDWSGNFFKVNKTNGYLTLIGNTGITPKYIQGGCFDLSDNTLYWFAYPTTEPVGLYTIDTETGKATFYDSIEGNPEVVGAYSLMPAIDANAPEKVADFAVSFDGPALTGTVSFTLPNVTASGAPLTDDVTYEVLVDGTSALKSQGTPGTPVSQSITTTQGAHIFLLTTAQNGHESASSSLTVYVGHDIPCAPASVTATKVDDMTVRIVWDAVTKGENNGYLDAENIRYTVKRSDGLVIGKDLIATTVDDTQLPENYTAYTYAVVASDGTQDSQAAVSNTIDLGYVIIPPYACSFENGEAFRFFTVIDANKDGSTWTLYGGTLAYIYNSVNAADDWVVSPPVRMEKGKGYRFVIDPYCNENYPESFEVMCGTAPNILALNQPVIAPTTIAYGNPVEYEGVYVPEADGNYYFGIHAISDPDMNKLYIDHIRIEVDDTPDSIANALTTKEDSGVCTLSGLRLGRVNNLPAGLYISNGEKYLVK